MGDLANYRKIVRNEEHPEARVGHDPRQQVGDLSLRRRVQ
jgi:hypothetical protein